jgi:hypothetical protein
MEEQRTAFGFLRRDPHPSGSTRRGIDVGKFEWTSPSYRPSYLPGIFLAVHLDDGRLPPNPWCRTG